MEIRPIGAAVIHADRWTDMTKTIGGFSDYTKAPDDEYTHSWYITDVPHILG
jgi:hypothetical protein